jgi:hypothetical protein
MAENENRMGMSPPEVDNIVQTDNNIADIIKTANEKIESECRVAKPICRPYIGDPNDPGFIGFCTL